MEKYLDTVIHKIVEREVLEASSYYKEAEPTFTKDKVILGEFIKLEDVKKWVHSIPSDIYKKIEEKLETKYRIDCYEKEFEKQNEKIKMLEKRIFELEHPFQAFVNNIFHLN